MDARIARVGSLAGWVSVAAIFVYHIGLSIIVGQRVSGTTDASAIEAYYKSAIIAPASILPFLAVVPIAIFALALREALGVSQRTRFLTSLALIFVVAEVPGILVQSALEATLVTAAARGGDIVPLFRFWDVLYNSGLYVLEAGWIGAFGLAMTGSAAFPRWLPRFSVVVAALQLINMSAIWVGIPDQLTLPGNLCFGVWLGAASVGLGRLATRSVRAHGGTAGVLPDRAARPARSGARATLPSMPEPITNDTLRLAPRIPQGGRALVFDFPGLEIGVAEYAEGPTGCTVFHFPKVASMHIDVRGGSPGINGEHLTAINAICFAGGSQYGLEASTGVAAELFAKRGYATKWMDIALVSGAIIFDYGRRANAIYPDKELGRAAVRALRPGAFPMGAHGAGCSATAGHGESAELSGQGGAFRVVGKTRIAVFTVVNAYGAIVDRSGTVVRGNRDPQGRRQHAAEVLSATGAYYAPTEPRSRNTNLTCVVTDHRLDALQLRSIARQVHASMARAIQPFHTRWDGDILYACSTQSVDDPALDEVSLGVAASELAWDAVLACYDD